MTNFQKTLMIASLATLPVFAQEHKWAGRTLVDLEWTIHEKLATLPNHGVFDILRFEVQDKTVVLSGLVLRESVKQNAEAAVRQIAGVERLVNQIEVLPSSRRDDALRQRMYAAIYGKEPIEKLAAGNEPPIHIIVKNGWVTLEGVVDSQSDRSAAHLRALEVTPHVTDHLRVTSEAW